MKVIKIGGKVLEEQKTFDMVVDALKQLDDPKILVHGGGNVATELAGKLGQPVKMIEGKRVTDKNMLDTVLMVYGGLLNKKLVAAMQARGMNAMGLTGADVNIIQAEKGLFCLLTMDLLVILPPSIQIHYPILFKWDIYLYWLP